MTRTLSIAETTCPICKQWYETPEEAWDCEAQDIDEGAELAADDEWWAQTEAEELRLRHEVYDELDYLQSLHQVEFTRP